MQSSLAGIDDARNNQNGMGHPPGYGRPQVHTHTHTQNFDRLNRAFVCHAEVDDENVWVGVFCQHYVHHETENKNR